MKLQTVAQLKSYLKKNELSPERFAEQVNISNMTIRRLLKKAPGTKIPVRYHASLNSVTAVTNAAPEYKIAEQNFSSLLEQIEVDGSSIVNVEEFKEDVNEKVKDQSIAQHLKEKVLFLFKYAFSADVPMKQRALALGALLYFVNPIDLIPDATPIIGYADDFAVITLVITCIVAMERNKKVAE